jgi:hypothetical protein
MRIDIRVPATSLRWWVVVLAQTLEHKCCASVRIDVVQERTQLPSALETLLVLDSILSRQQEQWARRIEKNELHYRPADSSHKPDLTINLTHQFDDKTCSPLYDGMPGELYLFNTLLTGIMPVITHSASNEISCHNEAWPSSEEAIGLNLAFNAATAAVIDCMVKAVASHPLSFPAHAEVSTATPNIHVGRYCAQHFLYRILRRLYRLCFHSPHWQIGWRWHEGPGVMESLSLGTKPWNILPDDNKRFYADPFPVQWQGRTFLFMEELVHAAGKGFISTVEFTSNGTVGTTEPVLEENTHLSYPFLIEDGGQIWMIPENSAAQEIALYRSTQFPHKWEKETVLISGITASDSTVVFHNGYYWLFCTVRDQNAPPGVAYSDRLIIFHALTLHGPWHPHSLNPVMLDARQARPAGNIVMHNGKLRRPTQDCTKGYGTAISLCTIQKLEKDRFEQTIDKTIRPNKIWEGRKLHTLNRAGPLETIDGTRLNFKWKPT